MIEPFYTEDYNLAAIIMFTNIFTFKILIF